MKLLAVLLLLGVFAHSHALVRWVEGLSSTARVLQCLHGVSAWATRRLSSSA